MLAPGTAPRAAALALATITLATSCGDGNAPRRAIDREDQEWATAIVPNQSDLGSSWRVEPYEDDTPRTCEAIDFSDLTVTGQVDGPMLTHRVGYAVYGHATILETEAEAASAVQRLTRVAFEDCVRELVERQIEREDAPYELGEIRVDEGIAPGAGERARRFDAVVEYVIREHRFPARQEVVYLQRGRALAAVVAATPDGRLFPPEIRGAVVRRVDFRMRDDPGG